MMIVINQEIRLSYWFIHIVIKINLDFTSSCLIIVIRGDILKYIFIFTSKMVNFLILHVHVFNYCCLWRYLQIHFYINI